MNAAADTIAAIATAPGHAGVGVLRVSGPLAPRIARTLLGRAPRERHAHYATFRDARGDVIDRHERSTPPVPVDARRRAHSASAKTLSS